MKQLSPQAALRQHRQPGIRLELDQRIPDLADQDIRLLLQLLAHHGVLCIVNQPVKPRELHDFASRWGEVIELTAGLALSNQEPGLPSITRVGNICPDGSIIPSVRYAEYWHHDGDFWAPGQNFIVNFLSSVQVPSVGGHTGFLDSRLAYETLGELQKAELAGAYICVRASEISDFMKASPHELPPDVQHPVLLAHPLTEQVALYLPDSSTGIQKKDGQFLGAVQTLIESFQQKLGILEHVWTEGDLVIIDNLQVMHRGMGGYGDRPRLLYRCQARIQGAREF
jgi:taurine dioxygenase